MKLQVIKTIKTTENKELIDILNMKDAVYKDDISDNLGKGLHIIITFYDSHKTIYLRHRNSFFELKTNAFFTNEKIVEIIENILKGIK